MPEIIVKNKQLKDKDVLWNRFFPPQGKEKSIPITYLSNAQIKDLFKDGNPYFATSKNKLIITLQQSDSDTEEFVFFKGNVSKGIKDFDAQLYFKFQDNKQSTFERDDFLIPANDKKSIFNVNIEANSEVSSKQISLDVEAIKKALIQKFNEKKVKVPQYGILYVNFSIYPKSKNISQLKEKIADTAKLVAKLQKGGAAAITGNPAYLKAINDLSKLEKDLKKASSSLEDYKLLIKCSFDTPHVAPVTTVSKPKVNSNAFGFGDAIKKLTKDTSEALGKSLEDDLGYNFTKGNFLSSPFVYDTFFVPTISASFVYNFYEPNEENYENYLNNYKFINKKLSDIPKYISLTWTKTPQPSFPKDDNNFIDRVSVGFSKKADTITFGGKRYSMSSNSDSVNSFYASKNRTTNLNSTKERIFSISNEIKKTTGEQLTITDSPRTEAGFLFNESFSNSISLMEQAKQDLLLDKRETLISDNSRNEIEKFFFNASDIVKKSDVPDAIAGINEKSRYVGYVIVKERLKDLQSENFEEVDTIIITNPRVSTYIDTKIAYGEVYRYRIRSIYKFINDKNLPMFDDPDIIINKDQIKKNFINKTLRNNAFYFDSQFSEEEEIAAVDTRRPDAPFNFIVKANSKSKNIFLTWNQKQQQNDVVGFNIYRRSVSGSFERLNNELLPVRNNFYIDKNVEYDKEYIYAVQSFDFHENPSKLTFHKKTSLKLQDLQDVIYENATEVDVPYSLELGEQPPITGDDTIEFKKNVSILINPLYLNTDRNINYLLKFTSLDSFIEKEIKLNFKTKIIIHRSSEMDPKSISRLEQLKKDLEDKERKRFGYTQEEIRRLKPNTGFDD